MRPTRTTPGARGCTRAQCTRAPATLLTVVLHAMTSASAHTVIVPGHPSPGRAQQTARGREQRAHTGSG